MWILIFLAVAAVVLFIAFRAYWDKRQLLKEGVTAAPKPKNKAGVTGLDALGSNRQPTPAAQKSNGEPATSFEDDMADLRRDIGANDIGSFYSDLKDKASMVWGSF